MTALAQSLFSFAFTNGPTMPFGSDLQNLANSVVGVQTGLTAHAGGGQTNALPLAFLPVFAEVDTVATTNDSIQLPLASQPGNHVWIYNNGANTLNIYANPGTNPNNGTTLDRIIQPGTTTISSNATAISLSSGHVSLFINFEIGIWKQVTDLSA